MSNANLTTTSYLVLGLVGFLGRATPYDLKRLVAISIGNFWSFPHSQLYAEPQRLAEMGLLDEDREEEGRRRRWYSLTETGREELRSWLAETTSAEYELRDLALLKLFFGNLAEPEDIERLARDQVTGAQEKLEELQALQERLQGVTGIEYSLATLRMGIRVQEVTVDFWKDIAKRPPGDVHSGSGS
jgi:DNA-binding PadR family transcriptional regulator